MRKRLLILCCLLLILTGCKKKPKETPALPTPTVTVGVTKPVENEGSANLQVLIGSATIKNQLETKQVVAGETFALLSDDVVTTASESVAVVDLGDDTLTRIAPESSLQIPEFKSKKLSFKQLLGNVYYRFKKIVGVREELEVESANTLAAVRGTKFGVFLRNQPKFIVFEHQIEATLKDASGEAIASAKKQLSVNQQLEYNPKSNQLDLGKINMTSEEKAWVDFNTIMDQFYDAQTPVDWDTMASVSAEFLKKRAPQPSLKPTATPTPTIQPLSEMPGEGLKSGSVVTDVGTFGLTCFGKNKASTRVITDSANEADCRNDCPVKSLADFATANGGVAAMNGMYFCPADYPACADKKNSFDTLLFNSRTRSYINSDNNVYSVIPFLVIQSDGSPRFVSKSLEWGRDTSIQAGIAGNPMLVSSGGYSVDENALDTKQRSTKSNRGAFIQKGDTHYLCIVKSATVPDAGKVFVKLHADNAINIDGGGSSALWVNGRYIIGPGRQIPNAIIFAVR